MQIVNKIHACQLWHIAFCCVVLNCRPTIASSPKRSPGPNLWPTQPAFLITSGCAHKDGHSQIFGSCAFDETLDSWTRAADGVRKLDVIYFPHLIPRSPAQWSGSRSS